MHLAVVGAGALGSIYAARLSHVAPVHLVVRDLARAPRRIFAERVNGTGPSESVDAPPAATRVPDHVDVVLLAVRADQLDDALLHALNTDGPPARIVVSLTPLLPASLARAKSALGDRLVVGMPGVVSYAPDPTTPHELHLRYWVPKSSPTMLQAKKDPADPRAASVRALAEALVAAGLPAELRGDVETMNAATTIAFFPLLLAIAAAGGSVAALMDDRSLLSLALDASKETRALAKTVGELAGFASLLLSFAGSFTVRAGVKLARSRSPESIVFLEKHFGAKLGPQNAQLLREILALADERAVRVEALERLAGKAGLSRP